MAAVGMKSHQPHPRKYASTSQNRECPMRRCVSSISIPNARGRRYVFYGARRAPADVQSSYWTRYGRLLFSRSGRRMTGITAGPFECA